MHIGIDVGGTNTDAVLMDGGAVLASVKRPTTEDVTAGIVAALAALSEEHRHRPADIEAVAIGTTQFTNAVVEGRDLLPTAVIRLCGPATRALPPMVDWPERLRRLIGGQIFYCAGGHEYDGRPIALLDEAELSDVVGTIRERRLLAAAITSVFSPVEAEHETRAAQILERELPEVAITISSEVGRVGLLERENAAILNACLRGLASSVVAGFERALSSHGIGAPLYLSQNDGTLMSAAHTRSFPVATFASGPTNSMRGAALLSGLSDCAVIDIGGTTTDLGMLRHGLPREAAQTIKIGGVRTNFRMPDVLSFGLGGGSIVRSEQGLSIGPDSVGYRLASDALVFGGSVLTATDLAVAAGMTDLGDPTKVAHLDRGMVNDGIDLIRRQIADHLDRIKTGPDPIPVVVVGGGSILLGDDLVGASKLVRPDDLEVANAIGAAIGQVGGEVERVVSYERDSRSEALARAQAEATARCVAAGANPDTVNLVDVEEVPLAYLPGHAVRLRVKVVGDLGDSNAAA
ncbi:MAG: hydantoinase/oxoprolinase N-terminal domain-containing protein [Acidimicrobiia bacterium]